MKDISNTTMEISRPPKMIRQIRENRWDDGMKILNKKFLTTGEKNTIDIEVKYSYDDMIGRPFENVLERVYLHGLSMIGFHQYTKYTIYVSGKKWRQNQMDRIDGSVVEWLLSNPSHIEYIYEEDVKLMPDCKI
tara:strand:+ start:152 stop:553 length:402 start_codon:yes stop_codon:yes gene_type:complete